MYWVRLIASVLACLSFSGAVLADNVAKDQAPSPPPHQSTLDKIKARGFVNCGSVLRPGLATVDGKGQWRGLEVEVCRAVATAIFGDAARYTYHAYDSANAFDPIRSSEDDLSFLTFAEMTQQKVTDTVVAGPPVFIESLDMLVADTSPAQGFKDLSGKSVCFIIGTPAEFELEAWFHDHKLEFTPFAFQEYGELHDTFNVQRCVGLVEESTALGEARLDRGVNRLHSRFINDHFLSFPVLATTPLADDAQWAAIVSGTIFTLINADAHETDYHAGGLKAMAVGNGGLGLPVGWQKAVVDRVGSYSDIFRRTLGEGSPFKMNQGLNRRLADGGVLVVPFRD